MKNIVGFFSHFIIMISSALFLSRGLTFYKIFSSVSSSPFLHFLHTTLVLHLLFLTTEALIRITMGSLTDSELISFNEKATGMFSDIIIIISFFPNDISMATILHFAFLYCIKAISWSYEIKTQKESPSLKKGCGGLAIAVVAFACAYASWHALGSHFSINILFALEYVLVVLFILKIILGMLVDTFIEESDRSFYSFIISIFSLFTQFIAYLVFIFLVTINFKFPFTTARSLIETVLELKKKIGLFLKYLKLCRDLNKIVDIEINGMCAICSDELITAKQLKCKHAFHKECLKMWCENEITCPICRTELRFESDEKVIEIDND